MAAFCPPGPEPMTTRSYSCMEPMDEGLRRLGRSCMPTRRQYRREQRSLHPQSATSPTARAATAAFAGVGRVSDGSRLRGSAHDDLQILRLPPQPTRRAHRRAARRPRLRAGEIAGPRHPRGRRAGLRDARRPLRRRSSTASTRWPRSPRPAVPSGAIAVIVDEDGASCRMCNDEHRELLARWPGAGRRTASSCRPRTSWTGSARAGAGTAPTVRRQRDGRGSVVVAAGRGRGARRAPALRAPRGAAGRDRRRRSRPARRPGAADRDARGARRRSAAGRGRARRRRARAWPRHAALADGLVLTDDDWPGWRARMTDPRVRDTLYALAVGEHGRHKPSRCGRCWRGAAGPWRSKRWCCLLFGLRAR